MMQHNYIHMCTMQFGTGHRLRANLVCEICITKRAMQELIGLCIVNTAGSTVLKVKLLTPDGSVIKYTM